MPWRKLASHNGIPKRRDGSGKRAWGEGTKSSPVRFDCPNCAAQYKLVRVEAWATHDRQIT